MSLIDKKFLYYSPKIKPGSHKCKSKKMHMWTTSTHSNANANTSANTLSWLAFALAFASHTCEPRQCKCKDKKTGSIGAMTPWPTEVESKIAYSTLDEKLTKSVYENIRCFMINIVQINWRKFLPEKMWPKK